MPALASAGDSSLSSLQLENEELRRQLRETRRESRGGPRGDAQHVERLERRCELLATRLVSLVRDRQLSECAEVHFLLRTQEEERRFLRDALQRLLRRQKKCTVGEDYGGPPDDELRSSMLTALVTRVAEEAQHAESQLKLEQTERRLLLEQTAELIVDIQQAIEKATRWVYDYHCEPLRTDPLRQLTLWKESHNAGASQLLSLADVAAACPPDSPDRTRGGRRAEGRWRGDSDGFIEVHSTPEYEAAGAATSLSRSGVDLLEACDVLRACYRALAGVRTLLGEAMSTLAPSLASRPGKLTSVEELVKGFHRDLQEMLRSNEQCRETLARRLEAEIEAHRRTVQKYEARLKLAERELIDLLTSAASMPRGALGSSDAHAVAFSKRLGDEAEGGAGDAGAATPPPPHAPHAPAKASASASAASRHAVGGGDTTRRKCTPGELAPPSRRRGVRAMLVRDKGDPQKPREAPCLAIRGNGAAADGSPPPLVLSLPEAQLQRRAGSRSLSSLDTLDGRMDDDSTAEGSVTHSPPPPPSSSSRRGRPPPTGEVREGRAASSSQRQQRWQHRAILLSPSPF
ncbi:uncharacterized protein Tco025E_05232 [Trypanosoma conorhini]|uniref:Uncharacterized protein n=1 Tax=Trypanosoma conorhini TaxID=83891 RepID=A0A3R7NBX8_9TRYP|nr:uncharacterized protein Tco025E_05232 [Trypanosoma conorhini]RNF16306.1 hypothetical protein Tco025E_05232 [Trypanosoma conorhini]